MSWTLHRRPQPTSGWPASTLLLLLLCLLLLGSVSTCQLFFTAGNELDIAEKAPARQWVAGL